MSIQRLTLETVGKIAAGEVIERPAAAVKELLENAIDAGGRRIDIAIAGGGIDELEVRDDGRGIAFDDLPLAIERHATSKIASIDDLKALTTLGFRGEALASLSAISDLRIQSLDEGETAGGMLRVEFGHDRPPQRVAWGGGTSIVARDLFANLPARRKFLRQPQTEANYVARIVSAYALAYPQIAFSLEIDGRRSFVTDGSGDTIGAAVAVWGPEIAGSLVPLVNPDETPDGFEVSGIVSLPDLDRATRQQQYLFAQGRLITSRQLGTAFEQAYHTLLMVGRHPIGCIQIRVPADRIDVNVHPTKAEVRFADERLAFALVQRATREAIVGHAAPAVIPTLVSSPLDEWTVQRRFSLAHPERHLEPTGDRPTQPVSEQDFEFGAAPVGGRRLPVLRVLGQVASMFIIAEGPDGMYLIDQHAAHERILFEKLMPGFELRASDRQLMLQPVQMQLAARDWETFDACRDELAAVGFEIEEFGGGSVLIRSVPAVLKIREPAKVLAKMLDEMGGGGRGTSRLESLAISAACHTSIRAGQALSLLEMRELVSQLEACSSPLACGHGRPTMLRMTAEELEKQFSRR
ncbi:MAG TPA: DNA mismatch repair endonuclease MutL [Thermomicrobiales bacterium]|nr:DNA mismatch repair endonuclease MutL [Thermomicrobiales bacterium]